MLYRKIAIVGATAAAIVGVGTAALATSGSSATSGSGTTKSGQANAHNKMHKMHKVRRQQLLRHLVHGEFVTHGKNGYVVHSGIRGTVSSVSATSLSVKASDGFTQTFTLSKDTKVRERPTSGKGRGTAGKVSDLKSGDKVAVLGKAPEKSSSKSSAVVVIDGIRLKK